MDIILIIGLIVGVVVGILYFPVIRPKRLKKKYHCSKCGTAYDYDNDIDWEVVKTDISESGTNIRDGGFKSHGATQTATVEGTKMCSNCGNIKKFQKRLVIGRVSYNGNVSNYDVNSLMYKAWQSKNDFF